MNSSSTPNNIIAIASGKGGVGKTWLAVTLAHLMARSGRQVLLFDGDIGLANVDVQLGLTPKKDFNTYITGKAKLPEVVMPYDDAGFSMIAGRSGSGVLHSLPMTKLQQFSRDLNRIASNYDVVLLDLGAGVEQYVRYLTGMASRAVVVVTDEPTSLTDSYAFIKLCHKQYPEVDIQVVVNQAGNKKEGEKTFAALSTACKNFLKFEPKLAGIVRRDTKVREAIRHQSSLIQRSPGCTAATDAAAISVKLLQK